MSSTTGYVTNNTGVALTFADGSVSHGLNPTILISSLDNGASGNVFIAESDGAGVEGNVNVSGTGNGIFVLFYDNPVVGSNSGSVSSPIGYEGSVSVGSGTNNTNTYILGVSQK
jgi:hypothetical protein